MCIHLFNYLHCHLLEYPGNVQTWTVDNAILQENVLKCFGYPCICAEHHRLCPLFLASSGGSRSCGFCLQTALDLELSITQEKQPDSLQVVSWRSVWVLVRFWLTLCFLVCNYYHRYVSVEQHLHMRSANFRSYSIDATQWLAWACCPLRIVCRNKMEFRAEMVLPNDRDIVGLTRVEVISVWASFVSCNGVLNLFWPIKTWRSYFSIIPPM